MFSLLKKKSESDQDSSQSPFAAPMNEDVARIAMAEDGQIVYASKAFLNLSHLSEQETAQQDFTQILRFERPIETPSGIRSGVHNVHINGHIEAFQFQFDWLDAGENRRYLIGSQTQGKSHTFQNNESTASITPQIERLLDLSHDICLIIDEKGKIRRTNETFRRKLGLGETNENFIDLFEEEDRPAIKNTLRSLSLDETDTSQTPSIDFEGRIKTTQGHMLWMQWRLGEKDGLFYCTGQDVTDIKTQEKALMRHEKQLLQAESLGRMGHWRWVLDEDEIEWSAEIYRIFGVDPESFEPTLQSMNKMVHRDDIDRVNQALQRAIIEENDYDVEFSITRPDGEERFIRSEGRCSMNDSGEVIALFGIMQDMTERMLYERELKNAKDAAERAYAAKTQFLANMSHELRTPLNAIIGFSEMIERQLLGPIGNEKYLDYIGGIRNSGEHLLDLISDILDMSKIEAGKYELLLEEINLVKTIKLAIHMMEGRALESNLKIVAAPMEDENITIIADRRAVLQIILNLLSNAVKFSKENGQITLECHKRDDYVAMKIIDNGIGIPANKLATITRPFEQVSSSYAREHEGSGLGLAITKELAELHGGMLFIDSKLDVGTTVTVRLPYEALERDAEAA